MDLDTTGMWKHRDPSVLLDSTSDSGGGVVLTLPCLFPVIIYVQWWPRPETTFLGICFDAE